MKRYEILKSDILNKLGAGCKDLTVVWDVSDCGDINCVKEDGTSITLEVPDHCPPGTCFTGVAYCSTACEGKQSHRISICPCTGDEDCTACQKCDTNLGYCIDICPDGQFCNDNGQCCECDQNNPCPGNKVCNGCQCECPPDAPYNVNGHCVDCTTNDHCLPNEECTPNGCQPVPCAEGLYVDPDTKECVECCISTHCPQGFVCDENKQCVCPPGFVKDLNGECRLIGCQDNSDCGLCEECDVINGGCIPKECPQGYFCLPETGDCVKECDCANPTCDSQSACIPASNGKCYCKPCEGSCEEGCSEGCYCNEVTNSCEPNPCSGPCDNGLDCGEGCGCHPTEGCVPCNSSFGSDALGCDCGEVNVQNPVHPSDCPPGYGIYNGECVCCSNFSCAECADIPGCICPDDQSGCEGGDTGCNDDFDGEKRDCDQDQACALVAALELENSCPCPTITAGSEFVRIEDAGDNWNTRIRVELRKGSASVGNFKSLHRLDETQYIDIAENEMPDYGSMSICHQAVYAILDDETGLEIAEENGLLITSPSLSFSDVSERIFENISIPKIGSVSNGRRVKSVRLFVKKDDDFGFPNTCEYKKAYTLTQYGWSLNNDSFENNLSSSETNPTMLMVGSISGGGDRLPLFVWNRSIDGTYDETNIIRKAYVGETDANIYTDKLFGPNNWPVNSAWPLSYANHEGLLISNRYWSVTNDCACADERRHDFGKVVFCSPCKVSGEVKECGKSLEIYGPFDPCEVNQDLRQFKDANDNFYTGNEDFQVYWELYLNNQLVTVVKHDKDLGMIDTADNSSMFKEYSLPNNELITSAYLKHRHSDECNLLFDVDYDIPEIQHELDCAQGDNSNYAVLVDEVFTYNGEQYTIESIEPIGGNYTLSNGVWTLILPKNTSTTVTFVLSNGCKVEKTFNENCCAQFSVNVQGGGNSCDGSFDMTASALGNGVAYNWYLNGNLVNTGANFTGTVPEGQTLTYVVVATDENGCEDNTQVQVSANGAVDVSFEYDGDICTGDATEIKVLINTGGAGTIDYQIFSGPDQNSNIGSGTLDIANGCSVQQITNVIPGSVYVFSNLNIEGCPIPGEVETIEIPQAVGGAISIQTNKDTYCAGEDIDVQITGPVGSNIVINGLGASINLNGFTGIESTTISIPATSNAGVFTITASGTNQGCNLNGDTTQVTVTNETPLAIDSSSCENGMVTVVFDGPVSNVVDQNGNNIPVIGGNAVTFSSVDVTSITVTPVNNQCGSNPIFYQNEWETCGCTGNETFEVTVNGALVPQGGSVTVGENTTVNMAAQNLFGSNCTISWSGFPGANNNSTSASFIAQNGQNYNIIVTAVCDTNGIQCTATYSFAVNVEEVVDCGSMSIEVADFGGCFGDQIVFDIDLSNVQGGVNTYQWTSPTTTYSGVNPNVSLSASNAGTWTLDIITGDGCELSTTFEVVESCDPCSDVNINPNATIVNESCSDDSTQDGSVVFNPTGGSAPYIVSGDLSSLNNTGLSSGLYNVTIEDATGCFVVSQALVIDEDNCCEELDLNVDGSFEDCSSVATDGLTLNGNVTCGDWQNDIATADTILAPVSTSAIRAAGLIASPNGGVFAGAAGATTIFPFPGGESFKAPINVQSGVVYQVDFYQANAGHDQSISVVGDQGNWLVSLGSQSQQSPSLSFQGYGSQSWSLVTMSFTASVTGVVDLIFRANGITDKTVYMAIDGIVVRKGC